MGLAGLVGYRPQFRLLDSWMVLELVLSPAPILLPEIQDVKNPSCCHRVRLKERVGFSSLLEYHSTLTLFSEVLELSCSDRVLF